MEEAGNANSGVVSTGTNEHGDTKEDPLEKSLCLVSVDNLFDIAVLVFEALVGVLQLIDALGIYRSLFEEAYCNGTKLTYAAFDFEEVPRLCDQGEYTLDIFVTIWEHFDIVVAINFYYFSILCLGGICIIGFYVYLRSLYNLLRVVFYYYSAILYSIWGLLWFLVGVAVFPLYLLFACENGISWQVENWCEDYDPAFFLCAPVRVFLVSPFSCADFAQIMLYPYSKTSTAIIADLGLTQALLILRRHSDDGASLTERRDRNTKKWFLSNVFEWAQTAGETLLVNIMKFGNLIYQVSDIARDIVYIAFLSKYSTSALLGLDLVTTTIIDIVMSSLLILKLFRDLGINSKTGAAEDQVNAETAAAEDQDPEVNHDTYEKESDGFVHTTWCEAIVGLVLLLILNILVCLLAIQVLIWLVPVFLLVGLFLVICHDCLEEIGCECDCLSEWFYTRNKFNGDILAIEADEEILYPGPEQNTDGRISAANEREVT